MELPPLTPGVLLVTASEIVQVVPDAPPVEALTDAVIGRAQVAVEPHAGAAIGDASVLERMASSDLRLVRLAVAYQAAWLVEQVDYAARTDVTRVDGDAAAVLRDEHALLLAPLASRCLARLSWHRSRTRRDRTRVRGRAGARLRVPPDVTVSHSVMDNPDQKYGFLMDDGTFWGAP